MGETVVVSSSEVPNPVTTRYAWQADPPQYPPEWAAPICSRAGWHRDNSSHNLTEMEPPHGDGYDILSCDGRLIQAKRRDLFYSPRV